MVKRKLTDEEKRVYENKINDLKRDVSWLKNDLEYIDMMITGRARVTYERTIDAYEKQKRDLNNELELSQNKIKVFKDMIENGVEEKGEENGE
jgi:hypothetical protein